MAVFVNYRRDDSEAITGRIDDHLRTAFGNTDVYRDIDSIPPGVDFVKHLQISLQQCDVCVAILGARWLSPRLEDQDDFVRLELETALSRGIPLIPVLVEGAHLPSAERLPTTLLPLLRRQAVRIDSGADFHVHVRRLVQAIKSAREKATRERIILEIAAAGRAVAAREEAARKETARESSIGSTFSLDRVPSSVASGDSR